MGEEQVREESYRQLAAIATEDPKRDVEQAAFDARRDERNRRRAAEDAEAQAWYDARPDVREALGGEPG